MNAISNDIRSPQWSVRRRSIWRPRRSVLDILLLLMMATFPLDFLNLKFAGFGWSTGRVLVFVVVPLLLFRRRTWLAMRERASVLGLLFIVTMFTSILANPSLDMELVQFYLPSYVLGVCVYVAVYSYARSDPQVMENLSSLMSLWSALIVGFSTFSVYSLYVLNEIPLANVIHEHAFYIAQSGRIMLPTNTPPHLSLFSAFCGIWWLGRFLACRRWLYFALFAVMLPICFLTFSRSGLLTFAVALLGVLFVGKRQGIIRLTRRLWIILSVIGICIIVAPAAIHYVDVQLGTDTAQRLQGFSLDEEKDFYHYYYRLQALLIFINGTPVQKVFGIGVGNYEAIVEDSPYSFSLYLTALAEQGLSGALLAAAIFFYPLLRLYRGLSARNEGGYAMLTCWGIAIVLALGNFLYEFRVFVPMWITIAWLHAVARATPEQLQVLAGSAFRPRQGGDGGG